MSKKKTVPIETGANPLEGYSTAIATLIEIARGDSVSRIRLEAAQTLLDNCVEPPWVDWGIELVDPEDQA